MTPSGTPREPSGWLAPLARASGAASKAYEDFQIDALDYCFRSLSRAVNHGFASWSKNASVITEATIAMKRFRPTVPGDEATKWIEVSIAEDGVDYVFREAALLLELAEQDLEDWHNSPMQLYLANKDKVLELEQRIVLCRWIMRHELLNPIPL
jgi:hypothetical protein